jgi:hypothetical protein
VYALMCWGRLQYIGVSTGILRRIAEHEAQGRIVFDQVLALPCGWAERYAVEAEMIRRHSPPYNVAHNPQANELRAA